MSRQGRASFRCQLTFLARSGVAVALDGGDAIAGPGFPPRLCCFEESDSGGALRVVGEALPVDEDTVLLTDRPGVVAGSHRGEVAGAVLDFLTVVHHDLHPAVDEVAKMRGLAAVGAGDRLDVLRPAPAGPEDRPADRVFRQVDELELARAALEGASLLGG